MPVVALFGFFYKTLIWLHNSCQKLAKWSGFLMSFHFMSLKKIFELEKKARKNKNNFQIMLRKTDKFQGQIRLCVKIHLSSKYIFASYNFNIFLHQIPPGSTLANCKLMKIVLHNSYNLWLRYVVTQYGM